MEDGTGYIHAYRLRNSIRIKQKKCTESWQLHIVPQQNGVHLLPSMYYGFMVSQYIGHCWQLRQSYSAVSAVTAHRIRTVTTKSTVIWDEDSPCASWRCSVTFYSELLNAEFHVNKCFGKTRHQHLLLVELYRIHHFVQDQQSQNNHNQRDSRL